MPAAPPRKLSSGSYPALVLNADRKTPVSSFPLSVWPWQRTVHAVMLERVDIIKEYDIEIRSPSYSMRLPHTVALKENVTWIDTSEYPAFTRMNLFLRDDFCCQYCDKKQLPVSQLTFDHVIPQSDGGGTNWENISAACQPCNQKKGNTPPEIFGMPRTPPYIPSHMELQAKAIAHAKLTRSMHKDWRDYLYWDQELGDEPGSLPWPTMDAAAKMGLETPPQPDRGPIANLVLPTPRLIIGG